MVPVPVLYILYDVHLDWCLHSVELLSVAGSTFSPRQILGVSDSRAHQQRNQHNQLGNQYSEGILADRSALPGCMLKIQCICLSCLGKRPGESQR